MIPVQMTPFEEWFDACIERNEVAYEHVMEGFKLMIEELYQLRGEIASLRRDIHPNEDWD